MTAIPPIGPAAAYPEQSQARTALIFSILGFCCCGALGIAGIVMANTERQAIDSGRRDPANSGTAQAAFIIGIIAVVLWALGVIGRFSIPDVFSNIPGLR